MIMHTVKEAAAIIGISERTARTYIKHGRLGVIRINTRRHRISQAAIDEFFARCAAQPIGSRTQSAAVSAQQPTQRVPIY